MSTRPFISIDQNCHPLWDVLPKLYALAARGHTGTHYLEDVDIAFSRQGAKPGDTELDLLPERIYRGGHSDWGAALFAHDFLGRLPLDVRDLEPFTGLTTAALSRRLETDVDGLYDRWSASDNWQLVGASYAEHAGWHRVIGDIRLHEALPFLRQLLERARCGLAAAFPEKASRQRLATWFDGQDAMLRRCCESEPAITLVDLYHLWMQELLPSSIRLDATSHWCTLERAFAGESLFTLFLDHYADAADAYNQALKDTGVGINPLHTAKGELPFFLIRRYGDRMERAPLVRQEGCLRAGTMEWPLHEVADRLEACRLQGGIAIAGKALILVLQARIGSAAGALALPHMGSLYMPAAHAFERRLRERGLLRGTVYPVWRVRLRFFEHWRTCSTHVRPPAYLARAIGIEEGPAMEIAEAIEAAVRQAETTLEALRDPEQRRRLVARRFADRVQRREELDTRRRELARDPACRSEAKALWSQIKQLDREVIEAHAEWVVQLLRTLDVRYYDSRGALLPWALALGGEHLFDTMVTTADIDVEHPAAR